MQSGWISGLFWAFFLASGFLRWAEVDPAFWRRHAQPHVEIPVNAPGIAAAQALALEHPLGVSDLIWLGVIQEAAKKTDRINFDRIYRLALLGTDFDPLYFNIYYSSAIQLSAYGRDEDRSDHVLKKGRTHVPYDWRLPFMMGYNAYFLRGDPIGAAEYWEEALQLERAPHWLPALASRARYQAGDPVAAEQMLIDLIAQLPEGPMRTDSEARLAIMRSEPILTAYDVACARYRDTHGQRPETVAALKNWAPELPPAQDLLGNAIELDENCRARTSVIFVREDEAQKRIGSQKKAPPMAPEDSEREIP